MVTHLRVLSESYPMNTNMIRFRWFSNNLCILVLWTKVAPALEMLTKLDLWEADSFVKNIVKVLCC